MLATPLLHKPVSYGSDLLNWGFVAGISLHAAIAFFSLVFGLFAVVVRKGSRRHLRFGHFFILGMTWTAWTGIALDFVRLSFYVDENHTKYFDYAMPSSYPARFAFLYAGLCALFLIRQGGPRVVLKRRKADFGLPDYSISFVLIGVGLGLGVLIIVRYNPWTGALWMIGTYVLLLVGLLRIAVQNDAGAMSDKKTAMHRFCMLFLLSFCGWGALQSLGPALLQVMLGVDNSAVSYSGDRAGQYDPAFWLFFAAWAPFFMAGAFFVRRFSRIKSVYDRN